MKFPISFYYVACRCPRLERVYFLDEEGHFAESINTAARFSTYGRAMELRAAKIKAMESHENKENIFFVGNMESPEHSALMFSIMEHLKRKAIECGSIKAFIDELKYYKETYKNYRGYNYYNGANLLVSIYDIYCLYVKCGYKLPAWDDMDDTTEITDNYALVSGSAIDTFIFDYECMNQYRDLD